MASKFEAIKLSRMKIHEDTVTRFYAMLDLYTPHHMRLKVWDEQNIRDSIWEEEIKQPISE